MQIILEKSCRKNLKIKISDERKERNAHVKKKKNWTENAGKKQLVMRSVSKLLRDKAKGTGQTVDFL